MCDNFFDYILHNTRQRFALIINITIDYFFFFLEMIFEVIIIILTKWKSTNTYGVFQKYVRLFGITNQTWRLSQLKFFVFLGIFKISKFLHQTKSAKCWKTNKTYRMRINIRRRSRHVPENSMFKNLRVKGSMLARELDVIFKPFVKVSRSALRVTNTCCRHMRCSCLHFSSAVNERDD